MIELSVALITYNSENYIKETLDSLIKQKCTFKFEIVVGDDCSTDNTFKIIQSYKNKYPELFNIEQNDIQLGIMGNFKKTIDRCNGIYVFNFDGDDYVNSDLAFQKIVDVFKKNPNLGLVDSGYDKYFESEKKIKKYVNRNTITLTNSDYKEHVFLGRIIPIGVCFKKSCLTKYVDFDTYLSKNITIEDYPTLVDIVANCDVEKIDESLFTYRIHNKSYSYNDGFDRFYFLREQMLNLFNYFKTKYNFNEKLCKVYEQRHYKMLLHLAGSHQKKDLGKMMFTKIESKNAYDIIHYLASQYPIIRYLARIRKFKNSLIQKTRKFLNISN